MSIQKLNKHPKKDGSVLENILDDILYDVDSVPSVDNMRERFNRVLADVKDENLKERLQEVLEMFEEELDDVSRGRDNLYDLCQEISSNNIDSWKDLVMSTLPGNCSAAYANDVEEALSKFTNIY